MSQFRLREATTNDAETIVSWFPTHDSAVLWGGPEVPNELTAGWLADQFADPSRRYYVLTDDAGRICGSYVLRPFPDEQRLHIGRFGVAPEMRGQGLGSLMIEMALALARMSGADKLTLFVYDSNKDARRLYERAGFVDYPAMDGEPRKGDRMGFMVCPVHPIDQNTV